MFKTIKSFAPAILWWILSLVLFTMPGSTLPAAGWFDAFHVDKWVHAFLFFVLVFLFYIPFLKNLLQKPFRSWQNVIPLLAVLYGVVIEILQHSVVKYRSFDVWDIVANAIGCAIAWYKWGRKTAEK